MTSWPVAGQLTSYVDAQTEATPLSIMKTAITTGGCFRVRPASNSLSLLLGNPGNAFGAYAFIKHRGYVIPEDVRAVAHDALRHRIGLVV